jgi:hypothetical protein
MRLLLQGFKNQHVLQTVRIHLGLFHFIKFSLILQMFCQTPLTSITFVWLII